ncbi:MAG: amidohydrolase family protein [Steroidobacter sp.]|nr:amidohydrolase family protein [Steroidobacter sp.]
MGFIDQRGPYSAPTGRLVETLEQARAAVRAYAAEGHVGIKLYSSINPSWVPVLASDARELGLRTAGHIPAYMSPAQAIEVGYNEITHINMMLLQLIGDWTIDTRTPQRFIVPGVRGGGVDVHSAQTDAFLDRMAQKDIAHDPTLATFMNQYRSRPGEFAPSTAAYADHLPPSLRRSFIQSAGYNAGNEAAFLKTGQNALKLIKRLHQRGIKILPGTDAFLPGFALVSELECYAEAGIPIADILRMATLGAAEHLGRSDTLGSIDVGKHAYLMLIDGDPTRDLSALRRVELVVKGRDLFRSRDILAAHGIRPFF